VAQRVQVELVDDLNGEVAQETVRFGVDGTEYEIDLTTENAEKLRSTLSEYTEKARESRKARAGRKQGGQQSAASASTTKSKREETQAIRQWAQENGHNPSSRGRINQSIVDAYNEAQK
jgi:hypothetical protein